MAISIQIINRANARIVSTVVDAKLVPPVDFDTEYMLVVQDGQQPKMLFDEDSYLGWCASAERAAAWAKKLSPKTAVPTSQVYLYRLVDKAGKVLMQGDTPYDVLPCFSMEEEVHIGHTAPYSRITSFVEWAGHLTAAGISYTKQPFRRLEWRYDGKDHYLSGYVCVPDLCSIFRKISLGLSSIVTLRDTRSGCEVASAENLREFELLVKAFLLPELPAMHTSRAVWPTYLLGRREGDRIHVLSVANQLQDLPIRRIGSECYYTTFACVRPGMKYKDGVGRNKITPVDLKREPLHTQPHGPSLRIEEYRAEDPARPYQVFTGHTKQTICLGVGARFAVCIERLTSRGLFEITGLAAASQAQVAALLSSSTPELLYMVSSGLEPDDVERAIGISPDVFLDGVRMDSLEKGEMRKALWRVTDCACTRLFWVEVFCRRVQFLDPVAIGDFLVSIGLPQGLSKDIKEVPQKETSMVSGLYQVFNKAGVAIQNCSSGRALAPCFSEGDYVEFISGPKTYRMYNDDEFVKCLGYAPQPARLEIEINGRVEVFHEVNSRAAQRIRRAVQAESPSIRIRDIRAHELHKLDGVDAAIRVLDDLKARYRSIDAQSAKDAEAQKVRLTKLNLNMFTTPAESTSEVEKRRIMTPEEVALMDVTRPAYYQDFMMGLQWLEAMQYRPEFREDPKAFLLAVKLQAMKYMDRLGGKDNIARELKKASWYIDFMTAFVVNDYKPIRVADIPALLKKAK